MKAIEVIGLTKRFGGQTAVDRVSFSVEAGDAVALVGPNGSGKTTLLRMLATLLKPSAGYATAMGLDGRFEAPKIRRLIGYMPDVAAMEDELTVREYLEFFAGLHGLGGAEGAARVKGLVDLLDLGESADRPSAGLSRGMQQRVGLARTLIHDPQILLLDEPAANLDARARIEIRAVLQELRKMGKTVVISSHILRELEDLCNTVVVFDRGQVVHAGPVADLASKMRTGVRVAVRVAGESAKLMEALAAEPSVESAAEVHGWIAVTLRKGKEDYAFVARKAVELGLDVLGLREEGGGLEDVFMQLTGRKGPA